MTLTASLALAAVLTLGACTVEDSDTSSAGDDGSSAIDAGSDAGVDVDPGPQYTVNQEQAIQAAEGYLQMGGYSRKGLINQLSSEAGEGFAIADAVFAVNHVDVDWKEQAVMSAKGYMEMGGYSRQGLIDQLTSPAGEQFSLENATYAVDQIGLK